ncbi:hypothetical protein GGR56DRAFT_634436 [Xylariaceae sp. FL0804]|nr:hypothetical protein GGR56DRAFT_634436 [Xylariaceae sp. FL0804]
MAENSNPVLLADPERTQGRPRVHTDAAPEGLYQQKATESDTAIDEHTTDEIAPLPPPTALKEDRRTQSAPDSINTAVKGHAGHMTSPLASPPASGALPSHGSLPPRMSLQEDGPPEEEKGRHSVQFDRRYDGPFGRPSMAAARRPSLPTVLEPDASGGADGPGVLPLENGRTATYQPRPPPLHYTLRTRKLSIFWFWFITVFDSVVCPIVLYFGLWYGCGPGNPTRHWLSANTVFSIVTAAIGGASIFEYFLRGWRLIKKDSTCRAIGASHQRWLLDWFHWWYTVAWLIVMVELIVGSIQEDPYIRLLSMPLPTMLFVFGTLLLVMDICRYFRVAAPVRISSIPRGSQLRPGIYPLIEDVVAVDGTGGTKYRIELDQRYEASHVFRSMLRKLGIFWAVGAEGCAVMVTILIFSLENQDAAYSIGWGVPFVWVGFWSVATIFYVKRELEKEKNLWKAEVEKTGL